MCDAVADLRSAPPAIWCVIVNWNACSDTMRRLEALSIASTALAGVVVVDNDSADNSVEKTRAAYPDVMLIEAGQNLGFAAGNNLGIRHALESGADYIWLLNNDTQPLPDALEQMLNVAKSDSRLGAVGSVLWYADQSQVVQSWGGGRINLFSGYNTVARGPRADEWFDYVCAGSMLVRREAFLDVGLLDRRYFLYWEDVDFGFRLRRAGWKLAVASKSIVAHRENASTVGRSHTRDQYFTASCLKFLDRWSPHPTLAKTLFLAARVANRLMRCDINRLVGICRGVLDYRLAQPQSTHCVNENLGR